MGSYAAALLGSVLVLLATGFSSGAEKHQGRLLPSAPMALQSVERMTPLSKYRSGHGDRFETVAQDTSLTVEHRVGQNVSVLYRLPIDDGTRRLSSADQAPRQ